MIVMDSELEHILDSYAGMISKNQAKKILENRKGSILEDEKTDVVGLLAFLAEARKAGTTKEYNANIEDIIYRIFNASTTKTASGRESKKRIVVIGKENNTAELILFDKFSDIIDINCYERGDKVFIKNAVVDINTGQLRAGKNFSISKIAQGNLGITDFTQLKEGMKNIDIIGKVIEIGPIRHVNKLNGTQIPVCDIVLSDTHQTIPATLWGNAAIETAAMSVNDCIKIEFCSVKKRNETLEIYANDYSRIVKSQLLLSRLH